MTKLLCGQDNVRGGVVPVGGAGGGRWEGGLHDGDVHEDGKYIHIFYELFVSSL